MISKELFVEVINDIKRADDYQNGLNNFFKNNDVDGYIYQPDCAISIIKLLNNEFGIENGDDIISYFCFELEFGKKWKSGSFIDNGNDIKLSSPEELYDYLISNYS